MFYFKTRSGSLNTWFYSCEAIMDLFHCVGAGQSSQFLLNIQLTGSLGSFQLYGRTSVWLTSLIPTNIS